MENLVGRFGITNLTGAHYPNKKGGRVSGKLITIVLATVIVISKPANAHEEKKRHFNKIESCGSTAVKTGKGRNTSPLRAGGAGALA